MFTIDLERDFLQCVIGTEFNLASEKFYAKLYDFYGAKRVSELNRYVRIVMHLK